MRKLFGKKSSSGAKSATPSPQQSRPGPPLPSRSQPEEDLVPPPLYARFARADSFDSQTPVRPIHPALEDLESRRSGYGDNTQFAPPRIYGNESVTRFGSGDGFSMVQGNGSRKDLNSPSAPSPVPKKSRSRQAIDVKVPSSSTDRRGAIGSPAPLGSRPTHDTAGRAPTSLHQQFDDEHPEVPRYPSKSGSTVVRLVSSTRSNFEHSVGQGPKGESADRSRATGTGNNETQPSPSVGSARPEFAANQPSSSRKEKQLPSPPPLPPRETSRIPRPTAMMDNENELMESFSNTVPSTQPQLRQTASPPPNPNTTTPTPLPAARRTPSATLLVHPSQRLRSPSQNNTTGPLARFASSSGGSSSASHLVPVPVLVSASEPPSTPEIEPSSRVSPNRDIAPSLSTSRHITPVTSSADRAPRPTSPEDTNLSPTTIERQPSPAINVSHPPSSHSNHVSAAVKAARRRSSVDFGTYDINAARKERERLMNASKAPQSPSTPTPTESDGSLQTPRASPKTIQQAAPIERRRKASPDVDSNEMANETVSTPMPAPTKVRGKVVKAIKSTTLPPPVPSYQPASDDYDPYSVDQYPAVVPHLKPPSLDPPTSRESSAISDSARSFTSFEKLNSGPNYNSDSNASLTRTSPDSPKTDLPEQETHLAMAVPSPRSAGRSTRYVDTQPPLQDTSSPISSSSVSPQISQASCGSSSTQPSSVGFPESTGSPTGQVDDHSEHDTTPKARSFKGKGKAREPDGTDGSTVGPDTRSGAESPGPAGSYVEEKAVKHKKRSSKKKHKSREAATADVSAVVNLDDSGSASGVVEPPQPAVETPMPTSRSSPTKRSKIPASTFEYRRSQVSEQQPQDQGSIPDIPDAEEVVRKPSKHKRKSRHHKSSSRNEPVVQSDTFNSEPAALEQRRSTPVEPKGETPRNSLQPDSRPLTACGDTKTRPTTLVETFYPLMKHLLHPQLLKELLTYLSFRHMLPLLSLNVATKKAMEESREVKEAILERYLGSSVGYQRWSFQRMGKRGEPLALTLRDLNSYMRGVSVPPHQYGAVAESFLSALASTSGSATVQNAGKPAVAKALTNQIRMMASSCRAYTKVVLRLRAQAEAEQAHAPPPLPRPASIDQPRPPPGVGRNSTNRGNYPPTTSPPVANYPKRSASPAFSFTSTHHSNQQHRRTHSRQSSDQSMTGSGFTGGPPAVSTVVGKFRSPLWKAGHAPLLRVFVPSPEGIWLSDSSVLECERELKRASVLGLLRVGDVVWDLAAGEDTNTGRLVWDGNYLIDLDYTYSVSGELPRYIDSLAFPPAYWHNVIRVNGNPICHIDLSPWAREIANNLQLIQDRVQTENPQGNQHTVVRWVHRTKFKIRPGTPIDRHALPVTMANGQTQIVMVDKGWEGTVIVEAESTNEGLEDLQARVGQSAVLFPSVKGGVKATGDVIQDLARSANGSRAGPGKTTFRLLRAHSRPGEIWLKCVRQKERIA